MEGTMGVQQDTELFLGGWLGGLGNLGGPRRDRVLPSVWDKRSCHEKTNMVQGLCCEMR